MSPHGAFVSLDLPSPHGVEVRVRDETAPYGYNNIFTVRLRVRIGTAGGPVAHERVLERMGVYREQLDAVRAELLAGFRAQIAPYLARPEFGERLAGHLRKKLQRAPVAAGYS
ncbi:MAG TPA: hypothetical protein VK997_05120 [Deferrisomatales bacterium]|nr:hypothetical protein [Deferrisomatales bacterium]